MLDPIPTGQSHCASECVQKNGMEWIPRLPNIDAVNQSYFLGQ